MASIRVIWLIITLCLHRFPAVEKMNVRSTHDPFFDKGWKELGRNEISRVGLFHFKLQISAPRAVERSAPVIARYHVSGFHV